MREIVSWREDKMTAQGQDDNQIWVSAEAITNFSHAILRVAGADEATATTTTDAMMHASLHGVDSHGFRLLPHYQAVMRGGRVNPRPNLKFTKTRAGTGMLDADDAHGARALYAATDHAADLAREAGIGAVGVMNSSHYGAAGAYTMALAKRGMGGMVFGNSDSLVRLHDGAERFHGTNPISIAFPTAGNPWLLDMATSSVPYNRVQLYASLGVTLPEDVASDAAGVNTTDPNKAEMLAPLGGEFGFKGAALGGVAEIFSAVFTGMKISPDLDAMVGGDMTRPRGVGGFVIAIDPEAFLTGPMFIAGMEHYLTKLRTSTPRTGARVMAPGDREWDVAALRAQKGIPLDPVTQASFAELTKTTGLSL